jgi:sialidase-1
MQHSIISRQPDGYISFPYVCGDKKGGHWAVFRWAGSGTAKAALSGSHTHQDMDSSIQISHRSAGQSDWSPARTVWESSNDGLAVNDPALTVLSDGSLLLRYARWRLVPVGRRPDLGGAVMRHFPRTGEVGRMAGNGFLLSTDNGESWAPLASLIEDDELSSACSRSPVIETIDGAWLLPVYGGYPTQVESAMLIRSWDKGKSWGDASQIAGRPWLNTPYREGVSYNETSVIALDEVTLLAAVRADSGYVTDDTTFISEGGVGDLCWTISRDAGFTWEGVRPLGLFGQPADLCLLPDGRVLCTYGHRRPPYGIRAAICELQGDDLVPVAHITLRDDADSWDCGYPASVVNADGAVTSVYYLHNGGDGLRHVACSDWNLSEMTEAP